MRFFACLIVLSLLPQSIAAQQAAGETKSLHALGSYVVDIVPPKPQTAGPTSQKKELTLADAVDVFLKQNLAIVAARYEIETADAEKLTARLRPNPEFDASFDDLPLDFSGPFFREQEISYGISQTFELGGKRRKRINAANANAELARATFQVTMWQLTNDLKRKFYTVVLAEDLLKLAEDNEKTFGEILKHSTELVQQGEIAGLDLRKIEVEKLKFDTDVANSRRDYEVALRDFRVTLGGDYRSRDVTVSGTLDYKAYQFVLAELRDKSLASRPDLKAAQISEFAADSDIKLQDAQRIPNLSVGVGIKRIVVDNLYSFGLGITLPIFDRNQGERVKALIQKKRAQNDQKILTNTVLSDVDKAMASFEAQKRRVELYNSGVLSKVEEIQSLTEFSFKAGESSVLDLLDAIRTRRETLANYYQTLADYQTALLDLELATATPLQK
ncbi:MAG TPA: TolC family protein [Blastocatellia bacterium]|nr:TolC family protein [Blastocatellia bacterium]